MNAQVRPEDETKKQLPAPVISPKIAEYSKTAAALSVLYERYSGVLFDLNTKEGDKAARAARAEIKGYRTDLEARRKEVKTEILERGRLVDSEAKAITEALVAIEDPIDAQIKNEETRRERERAEREAAEAARVQALQARISDMGSMAAEMVGKPSEVIAERLAEARALEVGEQFAEFRASAEEAKRRAVATLEQLLAGAAAQEKAAREEAQRVAEEREELARLRAAQEKRDAEDRLHREAEQARILAENKKRAEEEAAARAKIEAEQAESRRRLEAEERRVRARIEEEERKAEEAKQAREEEERLAYEKRKAEEVALQTQRDRLEAERREVERRANEIVDAQMLLSSFKTRFGDRKEFAGIIKAIDTYFQRVPAQVGQ